MYAQQPHAQPQWGGPPQPEPHYSAAPANNYPPYAPRQDVQGQQHSQPPPVRSDRPEMTSVNSGYGQPTADHYRLPAPPAFYPQPPQGYHQQPQPQAQQQVSVAQSAPRQRTAIACKYCRRRKIRCSGFENSEDGRCQNCARFSQECIFTPVSHQAQAFVPVQSVYGRGRNMNGASQPVPLYGAYGQRLPQQDPYGRPPPQEGYALPQPNGAYPPPPQGYPPQYASQYQQPPPSQNQYEAQVAQAGSRRPRDEPHTPTLPPPNPGLAAHLAAHNEHDRPGYAYPEPPAYVNGNASPATSTASYQSQPQPYYGNQPQRRHSPGSGNLHEPSRGSNSPHGAGSYTYSQPPQHGGQMPDGRTPPPTTSGQDNGATRNSVSIRDIVSNDASGDRRSAADKDMVSALNRPAPRR